MSLRTRFSIEQSDDQGRIQAAGIRDLLERLLLWAGNMGAMHPPISRLSLDRRLRGSPEMLHLISQHLEDLTDTSKECERM